MIEAGLVDQGGSPVAMAPRKAALISESASIMATENVGQHAAGNSRLRTDHESLIATSRGCDA